MPVQPHKAVSIELASQSANVITWTVVLTNGKTYRVQGYPGSEILMVCGPDGKQLSGFHGRHVHAAIRKAVWADAEERNIPVGPPSTDRKPKVITDDRVLWRCICGNRNLSLRMPVSCSQCTLSIWTPKVKT